MSTGKNIFQRCRKAAQRPPKKQNNAHICEIKPFFLNQCADRNSHGFQVAKPLPRGFLPSYFCYDILKNIFFVVGRTTFSRYCACFFIKSQNILYFSLFFSKKLLTRRRTFAIMTVDNLRVVYPFFFSPFRTG